MQPTDNAPNWNGRFDRIYCLHHVGMAKRMPGLVRELDRVGITTSGIFTFNHTSTEPWERYIAENVPRITSDPDSKRCYVNLGLALARIFREALALDYQRILVLEDDIRFLKDLSAIACALDSMPDWDIVNLEKLVPKWRMTREEYIDMVDRRRIDGHSAYFDGRKTTFTSGACFSVNRRGMEALVDLLDRKGPRPVDILFQDAGVRRAVIDRNIACQVSFSDAVNVLNLKSGNTHHLGYSMQGLDYADYNVPTGYGYKTIYANYES